METVGPESTQKPRNPVFGPELACWLPLFAFGRVCNISSIEVELVAEVNVGIMAFSSASTIGISTRLTLRLIGSGVTKNISSGSKVKIEVGGPSNEGGIDTDWIDLIASGL